MSYNPLPPTGQTTQAASLPVVLPSDGLGAVTSKPLYSSSIGTSQVAGTVTTVPSGTTVVSGNVSTTITGTTTIAGNVTSTITGTTAVNLYQVGGVAITLGQKISGSSMPVALSSDGIGASSSNPLYISGGAAGGGNAAAGSTGAAVPASADYTGFNSGGNLQGVSTTTPLPVGIYAVSGVTFTVTGTVTTVPSGTTTISGAVTSTPTGTTTITGNVTSAVNLYQVNGASISLGQTTAASSLPVTLASDGLGSATSKPLYHLGSTAVTNNVTTNVVGTVTTAVTNTVTTTPTGTTTVSGAVSSTITNTVTTTPTGTTTITGTVTTVPSGTTTVSVSNTVTSTITGTVTSAVNLYQVAGVGYALGSHVAVSSMPVVLASDGLGSASTTPLFVIPQPLTKGTQATTGVSVQNLLDAGRVYKIFYFDNIAGITSEALATTTINSGGTTTTGTSYSVTAGKTLRLTAISGTIKDTSSTAVYGRIRVRSAATVNATSGIIAALDIATPLGTGLAGGGMNVSYAIPDGIEIAASQQIGITHIENSASSSTSVIVTGFEY